MKYWFAPRAAYCTFIIIFAACHTFISICFNAQSIATQLSKTTSTRAYFRAHAPTTGSEARTSNWWYARLISSLSLLMMFFTTISVNTRSSVRELYWEPLVHRYRGEYLVISSKIHHSVIALPMSPLLPHPERPCSGHNLKVPHCSTEAYI